MPVTRLVVLLGLGLAACAAPPAPTAPPPAATPLAARPPGSFDGTYRGQWTVTRDVSGQCRAPVLDATILTVSGSEVRLLNPPLGTNGRGTITPDGRFRTVASMRGGGPTQFSGLIAQDTVAMLGTNRNCTFEARLTLQP